MFVVVRSVEALEQVTQCATNLDKINGEQFLLLPNTCFPWRQKNIVVVTEAPRTSCHPPTIVPPLTFQVGGVPQTPVSTAMPPCSCMRTQGNERTNVAVCSQGKDIEFPEQHIQVLPFCTSPTATIDAATLANQKNVLTASTYVNEAEHGPKQIREIVGNSKERLSKCLMSDYHARKYSCSVCNKKFKNKRGVNEHMRYHNEEKPFQCPECGKRCYQQTHLKEHMRIHTGEKPYQCVICKKQFRHATNYSRHKRNVHNISHQLTSFQ